MRLLFIGGTGLISSACAELALARKHDVTVLNRSLSKRYPLPDGATRLIADVHGDPSQLRKLLKGLRFDAVVDFLAFEVQDIERDLELLRDRTDQFVFISSASAYQKPPNYYLVTESTPLANPFWSYSQGKIACEKRLMRAHREEGFPVTIVRPSLTYGPTQIPFCVGSWDHPWTIIDRMQRGLKIIVPGDGTSLWVLTWNADFARGLVGLLGNPQAVGEAYQITSDEVLNWDQIYLEAFAALGLTPNVLHVPSELIASYWPPAAGSLIGDKMNSVIFDNRKIKEIVPDFACEVKWAEGVRRAIDWHRSHPQFQKVDVQFDKLMDQIVLQYSKAFP